MLTPEPRGTGLDSPSGQRRMCPPGHLGAVFRGGGGLEELPRAGPLEGWPNGVISSPAGKGVDPSGCWDL